MTTPSDGRICVCGQKKIDCACWAKGAGDEAATFREGFSRDQLALIDYFRAVLHHGKPPIPALVDALRIEMANDGGFRTRIRVARQILFGRRT